MLGGLAENRMLRVQGLAFSQPFNKEDPTHPSNRRISIIVMNREAEDRVFRTAPDTIEDVTDTPSPSTSPTSVR
jgi:chemotaxis protein MotB